MVDRDQLRDSLSSAIYLGSPNEHFSIPQGAVKNYTGRATLLDEVKHAFNAPSDLSQVGLQRRIVIYGLGGSGKTQFCCEYASLCRQRQARLIYFAAPNMGLHIPIATGASSGSMPALTSWPNRHFKKLLRLVVWQTMSAPQSIGFRI